MFLLIAVMFGILYGVITGLGVWMGAGSAWTYLILAFGFIGIQYLIGLYSWLDDEDKVGLGKRGARVTSHAS